MAEFCLKCWNRINGRNDLKNKYVMSKELEFCEECMEFKHVIVRVKGSSRVFSLISRLFINKKL